MIADLACAKDCQCKAEAHEAAALSGLGQIGPILAVGPIGASIAASSVLRGAQAVGAQIANPLVTPDWSQQFQDNPLRLPLGPLPTRPMSYDSSTAVFDPVFLRSDCQCRGGTFVDVPGEPQNSFCLPATRPTGKRYDFQRRGCVPDAGGGPQLPPSWCDYQGHNLCLYGGIAVGVFVLLNLLTGKKAKRGKRGRR